MYQADHHLNTIGFVKPNARLRDLINTAKSELCKLTKSDTIVMIGGSNDVDKNVHANNLTSIRNFIEASQNTNVILSEVPVRYDIGARPHISEQIWSFNKKLYKVTKSFSHVKMIKFTTNREVFTKHGLHLNNKGKEIFAKEILKNLSTSQKSVKTSAIHLPWKKEPSEAGTSTKETVKPSELLSIRTVAEVNKAVGIPSAQQGDNQETCNSPSKNINKISRKTKLQRNCPKIKNDDFLWN
jgi:hypothetical protein